MSRLRGKHKIAFRVLLFSLFVSIMLAVASYFYLSSKVNRVIEEADITLAEELSMFDLLTGVSPIGDLIYNLFGQPLEVKLGEIKAPSLFALLKHSFFLEDFVIEVRNVDGTYVLDELKEGVTAELSADNFRVFFQSDFLRPYLHAVRVEGLSNLIYQEKLHDLKKILENRGQKKDRKGLGFWERIRNPPFTYYRQFDSELKIKSGTQVHGLDYNMTVEAKKKFGKFKLWGSLLDLPLHEYAYYVIDEGKLFINSELEFANLKGEGKALFQFGGIPSELKQFWQTNELKFESGSLKLRKNGFLEENKTLDWDSFFKTLFMEFSGNDLKFSFRDQFFEIKKLISFITDFSEPTKPGTFNTYANFKWDDNISALGARVYGRTKTNQHGRTQYGLSAKVSEVNGSGEVPFVANNLSIPHFEMDEDSSFSNFLQSWQELQFGTIKLEQEDLKVESGKLQFKAIDDGLTKWEVKVPPLVVHSPQRQMIFNGLSYHGIVDGKKLPEIVDGQELNFTEMQLGDDLKFEDCKLRFVRNSNGDWIIQKLRFCFEDLIFTSDPANLKIHIPSNDENGSVLELSFNDSAMIFEQGNYKLEISGISGSLNIKSVSPFESSNKQHLTFDKAMMGEVILKDGNLSYEISNGSTLAIEQLIMSGFGGFVGLNESVLSLENGNMELALLFDRINGQRVLGLFEDFNVSIDGNFSGEIPILKTDVEDWDFIGGFLKFIEEGSGKFSWDAKGLLTRGLDQNDHAYKKTLLAEKALQNLSLESMKLDFKVVDGKRQVQGLIKGRSTVDGKKISLDYKPRINGNLEEILEALDLIKLQVRN